jgi:hypothetical protein
MSDLDNIRRGELKRLLRHRGASEIEVHNAVEDILAERVKWTAAALGKRMQLTFEEKIKLGINTFACIDRTKDMMRLFFQERKRERDRRRVNKMRERIPRSRDISNLSPRARQLAEELTDIWTDSSALVQRMQKRWRLKHDGLRQAVLRAARELHKAGRAEEKIDAGPAGGSVLFLRLKKPMNIEVSQRAGAGNAYETSTLRKGDSKMSPRQCRRDKNESLHRRSSIKPDPTTRGFCQRTSSW